MPLKDNTLSVDLRSQKTQVQTICIFSVGGHPAFSCAFGGRKRIIPIIFIELKRS